MCTTCMQYVVAFAGALLNDMRVLSTVFRSYFEIKHLYSECVSAGTELTHGYACMYSTIRTYIRKKLVSYKY